MNSQSGTAPGNEEARFRCTNWDTESKGFRVNVKGGGSRRKPARKVITKGVWPVILGRTIENAIEMLRKGYEVRFVDSEGNDAIRLFPMMGTDLKTMTVGAATMGAFRDATLADKKAVFHRFGGEVARETVERYMAEKAGERAGGRADVESVTPDMMVNCPKCGYSFRVGRRNDK